MTETLNLNIHELISKDEEIQRKIDSIVKEKNLSSQDVMPIKDGLFSPEAYLKSDLKLMWILKEPYDDFNEDGTPCGGGWSITKDFFKKPMEFANSSKTATMVTCATYGILNNKQWSNIDYLSNDPSIAEALKQIAYINLSKMPAKKTSSDSDLWDKITYWKPIILDQINLYDPEVIIFGNTLPFIKVELFGNEIPYKDYNGLVYAYHHKNKLYLWAYHPGALIKQKDYYNSLLQAISDWKKTTYIK